MADRVLDHLARPPAVPAIDDRGSGRKIQYVIAVLVLYGQGRIAVAVLVTALIDLLLGTLFIVAFKKTG
jgi:hypothetical protein